MKKIAFFVAVMAISGSAFAELQLEQSGKLRLGDCPNPGPIAEDVSITLTNGVKAGFGCNATQIAMSACHSNGRVTSRSSYVNVPADCDTGQTDTAAADYCTSTNVPSEVTGPSFPTALSTTGTVSVRYPVATTDGCTAANAASYAGGLLQ